MSTPFRIAIAGLGTVGQGVVKIIQEKSDLLERRTGRTIEIVAVSARNKGADRGIDLSSYEWADNPLDLAGRDDIDAVVELIGGSDGIAKDLAEQTLQNKKHFITANKALIAHHGYDLAVRAEDQDVGLLYEAAVAGGIPIIKSIREGLAGNDIQSVMGILNGTCNYILSEMRKTGRDFADVLKDAQDLGYAEADPSFDIEGVDAGHKLAILAALVFGVKPDFENLSLEGIEKITAQDIGYAEELGYRIKLLGVAKEIDGKILQIVSPCLVKKGSSIAHVEDAFNAVFTTSQPADNSLFEGRGAGEGPTASAVLSDIIDLARGSKILAFGIPAKDLKDAQWADSGDIRGKYYLHLRVKDEPGVIADLAAILRDNEISIESQIQREHDPAKPASVVIVTHETSGGAIEKAVEAVTAMDTVTDAPTIMRIEKV